MKKALYVRGVALVSFIFLQAFGGLLEKFAPPLNPLQPEGSKSFLIAVGAFGALIVLFFVLFLAEHLPDKRKGLSLLLAGVLGCAVTWMSFTNYFDLRELYAFAYPTDGSETLLYHRGKTVTALADSLSTLGTPGAAELLDRVGGLRNAPLLWPEESIRQVHRTFTVSYLAFVLSLAWVLFSLAEAIVRKTPPPQATTPADRRRPSRPGP